MKEFLENISSRLKNSLRDYQTEKTELGIVIAEIYEICKAINKKIEELGNNTADEKGQEEIAIAPPQLLQDAYIQAFLANEESKIELEKMRLLHLRAWIEGWKR